MRVLLRKDFQKQFLINVKGNRSWKEFSENLGTREHIIKQCAHYGNTLPEDIYNKIKTCESDRFVIKKVSDNWGRSKGGKKSSGTTKTIKKPKLDKKLAELVGVMLGDGSIYLNKECGAYQIRITLNINKERDYVEEHLVPIFKNLFDINCRVVERPDRGVICISVDSKELVDFFANIGLWHKGRKSSNVPSWIKNNKSFSAACLRGLIDTDGSIYRLSRKDPDSKRISFKNANVKLLKDFRDMAIGLGFHPSKITHGNIFITRKKDIVKYMDEIGFSNPKNSRKIKEISPVV